MQSLWKEEDEQLVGEILDQLIPANREKEIPGAGELGVAAFVSQRALMDPNAAKAITDLLNHAKKLAEGISPSIVRQLESEQPIGFAALLRLTYMGYYSRPNIRPLFGVAQWPVHPKGYDVPGEAPELMDELTAPVRARGQIYRDV